MSQPSKQTHSSPLRGDDRNVVAGQEETAVPFEEQLLALWKKHGRLILIVIALGFLAIIGREAVQYMWKERERGISEAYGAAATTAELKAFAAAHETHRLAGFAWLRIADEAYAARNFAEAGAAYEKAGPLLKGTPMAERARLGSALARTLGSDRAGGETALKTLSDDMTVMPSLRTEARYLLATLAIGDGRIDEARRSLDEIAQTDLTGTWAQRAFHLRMSLPEEGVAPPQPAPGATPAPASDGPPEIKLNLPGGNP